MGSYFWHGVWTELLYRPGNQTQIVIAAPNNDLVTDLQLFSYQLAANITAITWLLLAAITCLPTWLILGQSDLLQTTGSYFWLRVWPWSYIHLGIKPRSLLILPQIMMLLLICSYQLATYCSYHLSANNAAITWLLIAAVTCLPT